MAHFEIEQNMSAKIKVIGCGGGGGNAINNMIQSRLTGVSFIAANTDAQDIEKSLADHTIQLGGKLTKGLGAGANPEVGRNAALESIDQIRDVLQGTDMVFITAGMGGGTGTGAAPVIAQAAREAGALTVAVVTKPFYFEGPRRMRQAEKGIGELKQVVDSIITIPNDRLLQVAPLDLPIEMAFRLADDILRQGVQGISELVTQPGLINVDFSHIRNMMKNGGGSLLAIGNGEGENQAVQAVERALHHPMLEAINLENASGIIANFTGGDELSFGEVTDALTYLQQKTGNRVDIIPGVVNDKRMQNRTQVTLVITGIGGQAVDSSFKYEPVRKTVSEPVAVSEAASYFEQPLPQPMPLPQFEMAGTPNDLDIPAFMRRRPRE